MLTINVSKEEIYNEVDRRLSIESSVNPDKYDFIWVGENRRELLDGFWVEGCESVVSIFKRYLSEDTIEHSFIDYDADATFELKAEMPERYSSLLDGSVVTDVKMMIACNVVFGWLNSVMPDLASKYKDESTGYADDLRSKISYRTAPSKSMEAAKSDDVSTKENELPLADAKSDDEQLTQWWDGKCKIIIR